MSNKKRDLLKQFFGPVEGEVEAETRSDEKAKGSTETKKENKTRIINLEGQRVSLTSKNDKSVYENEVIFFEPESMSDCAKLGDWISDEKIVILSFENLDAKLAQRVIDFVSGALYVKGASIVEMGKHVQCCVPNNYVAVIDIPGYKSGNEVFLGKNELRSNEVEEIKPRYRNQEK